MKGPKYMDTKLIDKLIVAEAELDDVIVAITGTQTAKDLDAVLTMLSNIITRIEKGGLDK
jgi:hypothetical protein